MSWDSIPSICNSLAWVLTTMLYSDFSMWPKRKHLGRKRLPLSCSVVRTSPGFWTWLVSWPDGPPLNYPGTAGGMWMSKPVVWQSPSHQKKQMWLPKMSHPKKGHGKQLEICVQIDRFNFLPPSSLPLSLLTVYLLYVRHHLLSYLCWIFSKATCFTKISG